MQPQNEMDTENSVNIIMFYFTLSKFFSFYKNIGRKRR